MLIVVVPPVTSREMLPLTGSTNSLDLTCFPMAVTVIWSTSMSPFTVTIRRSAVGSYRLVKVPLVKLNREPVAPMKGIVVAVTELLAYRPV